MENARKDVGEAEALGKDIRRWINCGILLDNRKPVKGSQHRTRMVCAKRLIRDNLHGRRCHVLAN